MSVTRQWYMRLDAGCCEMVYRLVTVELQPEQLCQLRSVVTGFTRSRVSRVVAFLAVGRLMPVWRCDDISQEPDWCLGNSSSRLEILLQSSTSPSFFSETRNNNRQIVFYENHFQSNLQMRYLHNSIFKSNFVIKRHSVTSLMMLLKFISKKQDILIYKCAKGIFLHNVCATFYFAKFGTFLWATRYNTREACTVCNCRN